jgi:hypothetical protein
MPPVIRAEMLNDSRETGCVARAIVWLRPEQVQGTGWESGFGRMRLNRGGRRAPERTNEAAQRGITHAAPPS